MSSTKQDFKQRPKTLTRFQSLSEGGQVIVVTQAYGPNGEDLMDQGEQRFSGERGIRIRVRQGELEEDVLLSPFFGDPSKMHGSQFASGRSCELLCPSSGLPLDRLPMLRTDEGGFYYAIYLTPRLQDGEFVAVNDIWGNSDSRIISEGEVLEALAELEISQAEDVSSS